MRLRISIRGSVCPSVRRSVRNAFVSNTRKRVTLASEVGGLQREVMGSDEGGRERGDEGGATMTGRVQICRGTHLTAVYPALLF